MENIVLLSSMKTKTGKTVITYGTPITKGNKKGFDVSTQFIDLPDLHDKFGLNDFGKSFNVEMGYQDTFGGQAYKVIDKLFDDNGEIIFER